MDTRNALAIFVIAAAMVIAIVPMAVPVTADKSSAQDGLNEADEKVHDKTPGEFAGDEDIRFHEGTCQGGHPVDIPEGCDNDLITEPGESEDHP